MSNIVRTFVIEISNTLVISTNDEEKHLELFFFRKGKTLSFSRES